MAIAGKQALNRPAYRIDGMGSLHRSHRCGEIRPSDVGKRVTVMGWVDRTRDLGNLIFVDLRDREGTVQVVASAEDGAVLEKAKELRSEDVAAVVGNVIDRDEETVNDQIPTGTVEVRAEEIRLLSASRTPPFPISEEQGTSEETRLRYRYLDLRRPRMQANVRLRHEICLETRKLLDGHGFLEIETPFLTRSTPEGARDYLVPSRVHRGQFYALPQSPQLFKQLLMVSGFDRYFQIVRCFRDEDLRADRQPEFTQIDIEMSFVQPEDVFRLVESLLQRIFKVAGYDLSIPFPRLSYAEAMSRYGTDRPDTRFGLELRDVGNAFAESGFQIFRRILGEGGCIRGIRVPGKADYTRRETDELTRFVTGLGTGGLAWIKSTAGGFRSSLPKSVGAPVLQLAAELGELEAGDILLMVAGAESQVDNTLSLLRLHLAHQENLIPDQRQDCLWVYDFPLLEWSEEDSRFLACHHPFTSPKEEDLHLLDSAPERVRAKAYDVVLNGTEIGGGSIRIHSQELQARVFEALRIGPAEMRSKFGFFLDALRFGAPPHGGIALGLDRIVMILAGEQSIRDVICFPKTARAMDLMSGSPSGVSLRQQRELHLRLT